MADSPKRREANAPIHITNQKGAVCLHRSRAEEGIDVSQITEHINPWQWLDVDSANAQMAENSPLANKEKVIVPYAWWHDCRDAPLVQHKIEQGEMSLGFLPDDDMLSDTEPLREFLTRYGHNRPIGIYFPIFRDGRGYSHCATLRSRFDFLGEVWAFGDVLADQAQYLTRVGFDGLVLRADQNPSIVRSSISSMTVRLQNDWRQSRSTSDQALAAISSLPQSSPPHREKVTHVTPPRLWSRPSVDWNETAEKKRAALIARLTEIVHKHSSLAVAHSLQVEDSVLTHALQEVLQKARGVMVRYLTLDTLRLPDESYQAMNDLEEFFGIRLERIKPDADNIKVLIDRDGLNGFYQSEAAKKACCAVRKVEPIERTLADSSAWLTGQRQAQSTTRAQLNFEEPNQSRIKYNPLYDWLDDEVWGYAQHFNVPVHPLYRRGYPSIGCEPCTRAVREGEPIRSGRWWWLNADSKECGLHLNPTS